MDQRLGLRLVRGIDIGAAESGTIYTRAIVSKSWYQTSERID